MELVKKNIHMDRIKCRAASQVTLDDDVNISDTMPDALSVVMDRAELKADEIKAAADHVTVKGTLVFSVLYLTEDGAQSLYCMDGKVPFEEQVFMEGVENGDAVNLKWDVEDFSASLINSRKFNVQALLNLRLSVDELYDEETAVEMYHDEPVEYCKKALELAQIAVQKKDIFRIKEEAELPQNYPNVFQVLWESVQLGGVEFRVLEEKISVQGEITVFVLYEGEGEEAPMRHYEAVLPFNGMIECHGCSEAMFADIDYAIGHKELEIRPDFDGEERVVGLELVLDLDIKLYEEETVELLSDVYGVTKEVEAVTRKGCYKRLLTDGGGKMKAADHLKVKAGDARILQLCHSEGTLRIDSAEAVQKEENGQGGIQINGSLDIRVLYVTNDDRAPYAAVKGSIPFSYMLEAPGADRESSFEVRGSMEQLTVSMLDSEEIDVKAVLDFKAVVFGVLEEDVITELKEEELDQDKLNNLPGIAAYIAREGDTLWQIGKKYYVPVAQIREMNNLSSDELKPGDKLLIVK